MAIASNNYSSTTDSVAIPITLAGLATSASLLAGQQSTIVSNITNKFLDVIVTGQITTGTTPTTAKQLVVYIYVPTKIVASAFSYPVAGATMLGEADAARTFDAEQRSGALIFAQSVQVNATTDRAYTFNFSVAGAVGYVPPKWGLFVTHDTVAALNATAANHWFHYTGLKTEVV